MSKILNLTAIREARERLQALAREHPELLGPSTTDEWVATLNTALGTAQRQQSLKQRRHAQGQVRVTLWTGRDTLEELRQRYPGPRGGVDWQAIIAAALGKSENRDVKLPSIAKGKKKPVITFTQTSATTWDIQHNREVVGTITDNRDGTHTVRYLGSELSVQYSLKDIQRDILASAE